MPGAYLAKIENSITSGRFRAVPFIALLERGDVESSETAADSRL